MGASDLQTNLLDTLDALLDIIHQKGVSEFSIELLEKRSSDVATFSAKEISEALYKIWKTKRSIYPSGVGPNRWRFGCKPFPVRRPISGA
jgi:hypothetical protein